MATEYHYAIKIVCGNARCAKDHQGVVAAGKYFTAVNIFNPSTTDEVTFLRKVVSAFPGLEAGPVSEYREASLGPCRAAEMDCPDVFREAPRIIRKHGFVKGFLFIRSPAELDIVAVYTTSNNTCGSVNAIHTERVPGRKVNLPCEDLDMSINTGTAEWMVSREPRDDGSTLAHNPPVPAGAAVDIPGTWAPLADAVWLNTGAADLNTVGDYTYQLCFCLCEGFRDASLNFEIRTDNVSSVRFNGVTVATTNSNSYSANVSATSVSVTDQGQFAAGTNCLEVDINNSAGPTGFIVAGNVSARNGKCPDRGQVSD